MICGGRINSKASAKLGLGILHVLQHLNRRALDHFLALFRSQLLRTGDFHTFLQQSLVDLICNPSGTSHANQEGSGQCGKCKTNSSAFRTNSSVFRCLGGKFGCLGGNLDTGTRTVKGPGTKRSDRSDDHIRDESYAPNPTSALGKGESVVSHKGVNYAPNRSC